MKTRIALTLAFLLVLAASIRAGDLVPFEGRVLDRDGKPAPGVDVATFWQADNGAMKPYNQATTDRDGRFTVKTMFYGRPVALLAVDQARKTGGIAVAASVSAAKGLTIRLEPLVHVHGSFFCKELGKRPSWTNVIMTQLPGGANMLDCSSEAAAFSFLLPPGKYKFWGYGTDVQNYIKDITLSADKPDVDMGVVDIPATIIARHIGKAPPVWTVTDARGVKKDVRIEDFKGKWVYIEFWGFW